MIVDLNLADVWETVADCAPTSPAAIHGQTVRTWAEFEDRAARLAGALSGRGVGPGDKIAMYLRNGPEYLEATFAAFKLRAIPVNVNYRYQAGELQYLLDNSDARAVVCSSDLSALVQEVREDTPLVTTVLEVGQPSGIVGVEAYEAVLAADRFAGRTGRGGSDLWFLYTGGTTGMPKGVMWPHSSLLGVFAANWKAMKLAVPRDSAELRLGIAEVLRRQWEQRLLPAAPLMHGTSAITAMGALSCGGAVVTLESVSFDPDECWRTVDLRSVTHLTLVGDAFSRPLIDAYARAAAQGHAPRTDSLRVIYSSGTMWSAPVKQALLERTDAVLADLLGSSEGTGFASSVSRRSASTGTGKFRLGEFARVITEKGTDVEPGSGDIGVVAVGGPIPIGYYKDPAKSAQTFRTIDGQVWSVPGDFATVEADGTITLLGRGSVSINTGGEKVFPEEVEEALKTHSDVVDANVVGVPDERWGAAVVGVVQRRVGSEVSEAELREHAKLTLAGYKCPKRVVFVDRISRGPNGKPDYRWAQAVAEAQVAQA